MEKQHINELSRHVVQAAYAVHKELGPGLIESVYQVCFLEELRQRGIRSKTEVYLQVTYKGMLLEKGLRLDLLVEDEIIVEIKAVEAMIPVYDAQLLSYLKLTGKWLGFLINFHSPVIKTGIKRMVNGFKED